MSNNYINLNRTFTEIEKKTEFTYKDSSELYNFFGSSTKYFWDDLLETDDLTIILGEAGSGKTTEFEKRCDRLKKDGYYSFFIELEDLINNNDISEISSVHKEEFREWNEGYKKGYFFLDSIDESKFKQRKDFEKAINNFKRLIGTSNLERCKIIISSRYSEWHSSTDIKLLEELIPQPNLKKKKSSEKNELILLDTFFSKIKDGSADVIEKEIRIFRLNPLVRSQVKTLSTLFLDGPPTHFIEEIDSIHAWPLARRPLDVEGLIYIWQNKGELGSYKDILDHHIQKGTTETPEREDLDVLSPERALNGAKCLAATVLLTKKQKFYPIRSERDLNSNDVLLPQNCLPNDWRNKEIKFLLLRRIFDKPTFNTIKFHLKSLTEYLAALWFKDRLDSDGDYKTVRNIFFKEENGNLVIKDSFKPIVAWLAIGNRPWNKKIRQDILVSIPELFLKYGDPSKLPTDYLLEIIKALRDKFGTSKRIYAEETARSLSYIGKDELAPDFEDWLRDNKIAENFKYLLLKIALQSEMSGLSNIAKEIAIDKNFYPRTRNTAISYLGKIEQKENIKEIKEYLFSDEDLENSFIAATIEAFYPHYLTNSELFELLKNTDEVDEYSVGIEYQFKRHIEAVASSLILKQVRTLVQNLITLIKEPPHKGFLPYSKKYYWLGDGLFSATKHLIKRTDKEWDIIAKAIYHLHTLKRATKGTNDIDLSVFEEMEKNSELRRSYFWYCHEMVTNARGKEPHLKQIFGGFSAISSPKIEDIEWLIEDAQISEKRKIALKFILRFWNEFNRPFKKYYHFRRLSGGDNELKKIFSFSIGYYLQVIYREIKFKFDIYSWPHWYEEKKLKLKKKIDFLRTRKILYKNFRKIYSGEHEYLLVHLTSQCSVGSGSYSEIDLNKLNDKYSKFITWAYKKGVKKYWSIFTPNLPHENPNKFDRRTFVGLAGITLALKDQEIDFEYLSEDKVKHLLLYAVNELNNFAPWLEDLTKKVPLVVANFFEGLIDEDWNIIEREDGPTITITSKIRTSAAFLIPLLKKYFLNKLSNSLPSTYSVLKDTLGILIQDDINHPKLIKLCKTNVKRDSINRKERLLWYSVWIQLDAEAAIDSIQELIKTFDKDDEQDFIVELCASLESRKVYANPSIENPDYLNPKVFRNWFALVHKYIPPKNDVYRSGPVTSSMRAQDFRRRLLDRFMQIHPNKSKEILNKLSDDFRLSHLQDKLNHLRDSTYQNLIDQEKWEPEDIPKFMEEHEVDPKSTYDLFQIVLKRLKNIKDEVEREEHGLNLNSIRENLISGDNELELRKFLTRQLKEKANGKYTVAAEEELNPEVEPDIRIHKESLDPISIEIKWAQRWSGPDLLKKLKEQLVDQYLRAPNCNYGIYFVGFLEEENKNKNWQHPETGELLNFQELIESLKNQELSILKNEDELKRLKIIDIDFNG